MPLLCRVPGYYNKNPGSKVVRNPCPNGFQVKVRGTFIICSWVHQQLLLKSPFNPFPNVGYHDEGGNKGNNGRNRDGNGGGKGNCAGRWCEHILVPANDAAGRQSSSSPTGAWQAPRTDLRTVV
ncbi:hypothetical protein K438DRAFT_1763251 [Mycena galopus ATCC 62051]|nr:hypothetical protein K438DRAFT_1763251 [Mycena galopus ATCC 62051]